MAVNGIEIEVGQEWRTFAGATVTVEHLLDGGKFLAVDRHGSTIVYDINGRSDTNGAYLASDLEALSDAGDTITKTFANREEVLLHIAEHGSEPNRVFLVGREVQPGEEQRDPLDGLQVRFAGDTDTIDADQLASETLSALGWTFDGQCWVQPEQSNWPTATQSALDIQHGGNHYKGFAIQPVEFIHANGVPFIEGNCIKYLMRWREKGGVKDLDKVKHYVDLLIELEAKHTKVF